MKTDLEPERMNLTQVHSWVDDLNAEEIARTRGRRSFFEKILWFLMSVGVYMVCLASTQC